MKTTLNLRTASVAIAASLASTTAVQAKDNAADQSYAPELDVVIAAEDPDRPTAAGAQVSSFTQGNITIPGIFAPVEMNIPKLSDPAVLEPGVQQAIYDVDFVGDIVGGFVTLSADAPISAPSTSDVALLAAPIAIEGDAQQAIYDVNFPQGVDGFVSTEIAVVGPQDERVVEARSLTANWGDINPFYGDIDAFYGDIDAFWGDINPFYGDIGAFYGDIGAFWGDINPFYGDIVAFWGDIDAFYGDIGAFWGDIVAFKSHLTSIADFGAKLKTQVAATEFDWGNLTYWTDAAGQTQIAFDGTPNRIRGEIEKLISQAEAQYGAAYKAKTGKDFRSGFVAEILAKHGIDLADTSAAKKTLAKDAGARAQFYLDWHDSLNQYSGIDAVDHWMGAVNWTPSITQIQGNEGNTVVGVIDAHFGAADNTTDKLIYQSGSNTKLNGHGSAVASLIFAPHDGEGVMGIAPNATVTAYNPFGLDGKATWDDVRIGINSIKAVTAAANYYSDDRNASVINLSLGEKGFVATQGLADVFAHWSIKPHNSDTTYVIAAGNEGAAQTTNINWSFDSITGVSDAAVIFVGSLGLDGKISKFSNTPGSACLLNNGSCANGSKLMNHFIVAPGELLLVDDGYGGVTRASGTSFAAPLVSGAIALLHDRWPWLANNPEETAQIIFKTAKDLGAPGVDAIYGHGLLDIAASQSPIDFNTLDFYMYQRKGSGWRESYQTASGLLRGGLPSWWDVDDVYFTAYEDIGDTWRDFAIPVSAFQRGKTTTELGGGHLMMQNFIEQRFANWLISNGADKDGDGQLGVSQISSNVGETSGEWQVRYDAMAPRFTQDGAVRPVHNAATLTTPDGKASFTVGHGQGALALAGGEFGIMGDHDQEVGGVNPVLGLASGEFFAGTAYNLSPTTKLTAGYSAERHDADDLDFVNELDRHVQAQLGAREAEALTVGVEQKVGRRVTLGLQWTHLDENDALLGAQTGVDALLGEGSRTDAMTFSANVDAGNGLSFDLSVTGGATATNEGQLFATTSRALSTAGQFAINKRGVMNSRDILRVSVGQPLTVESGQIEFRSDEVVDRETGELGAVVQTFGIDTKRRLTSEVIYATPVSDAAEFGLMGRYVSAGEVGQEESFMIGANFGLRF